MATLDSVTKSLFTRERKWLLAIFVVCIGAVMIGAVATQQPLLAIAGAFGALLLLVILRWPDTATLLVVFFIYTNAGPVAIRFHSVPPFIAMAFPVLLFIPLVWYLFFLRQKLVITPVLVLLVMLFVVYAFGAAFSKDINLALPELINFAVEGLLLYFLFTNVIRTPLMLKRVVWVLLIAGALIGGLSLFQQVTHTFDNNYGGFAQVEIESSFGTGVENLQGEVEQPRLAGSIGEKNRYAQTMLMLVPLGLFQLWIHRSKKLRMLALAATGLIAVGGALSFSRGAAVGFVLMILIMAFLRYIKVYQLALLLLGAMLVLWMLPQYRLRLASLDVFSGSASSESGRPLSGADGSIRGRATELLSALLVFRDHPVFGVGPGMFPHYIQEYAKEVGIIRITQNYKAHSLFPGIAADGGVLGLICFGLILFIPLRDLARARKQWMESHPDWSYLATAFFQALISYIVTGLFLHLSYMRFLYLIVALAVVASKLGESDTVMELDGASKNEDDLSLAHPSLLIK